LLLKNAPWGSFGEIRNESGLFQEDNVLVNPVRKESVKLGICSTPCGDGRKMKTLTIEWKHLDKEGATRVRCSDTGKTLADVVKDLSREWERSGIRIVFKETSLTTGDIRQSNQILFNGRSLEDIIPGAMAGESSCASCCDLIGKDVACRAVEHEGTVYEVIPERLIRAAACRVTGY